MQFPGAISDHSLIHWRLPVVTQPIIVAPREFRKWKSLDYDKLRCALLESELCDVNNRPRSAEEYFDRYERVLRSLVHDHVPVTRLGRRRQRLAPWMDAECFSLRRLSKRLEKRYRRSGLATDRLEWVQHERRRHKIYRQKESAYWNLRLSADASSSKRLWRTLNSMMGASQTKQTSKTVPTAQHLLDFFNAKINVVRQSTGNRLLQFR